MNDTDKVIPMGDAEWMKTIKSIPVVCDIDETTAEGVISKVLKAVFEKNCLPMDKFDEMASAVMLHSQRDIGFSAVHGIAIPHGYVPGLEKLLVGVGVLRNGHSIDVNAIDGSKTHIFFVIVCSNSKHEGYRQFLARLCRCFISDDMASRLAAVSTRNDLENLLNGAGDTEEKQ